MLESLVNDQVGPGSASRTFSNKIEKFLFADEARVFRDRLTAAHFLWSLFGLTDGDGVLFSPFGSWLLAYSAVQHGLVVHFCDVAEDLPVLSVSAAEQALQEHPEIKLVLVDHPYGLIPDVRGLRDLGVPVVEDLRWGLGGTAEMELVGSRGQAALVSLEDDGVICAGGGEGLLVRGRELAQRFKSAMQDVSEQIFLSDLNAALGLAQFDQRSNQVGRRRELLDLWTRSLRRDSGRALTQAPEYEPVPSHFLFRVPSNVSDVIAYARKKGVTVRQAFQSAAYSLEPTALERLPYATAFLGPTLLYPLFPALSTDEQKLLLSVLGSLP